MATKTSQHAATSSRPVKVAVASLIGTSIEWYDFYIYGTAAALVFDSVFFPSFEPLVGTLLAFASFGVGTIARPLGGFLFGHFGDRVGRKRMLILSLFLMGVATVLIGALPGYAAIGLWAPVLLVTVRIVQGIALGGEWGGAVLMTVEHAPPGKRAFYGCWPQVGSSVGLILGTAIFAGASLLPDDQFLAWGWRVPFLLSIVLVVVGLVVRSKLTESPEFLEAQRRSEPVRIPLVEVFRRSPRNVAVGVGAIAGAVVAFYVATVFTQSYAMQTVGVSRTTILIGIIFAAVGEGIAMMAAAIAADRFGTKPVGIAGAVSVCLAAFPFFLAVNTGNPVMLWLAFAGIAACIGMTFGIVPIFVSDLFPTHVRYSGSSASYALAAGVIGGLSPLVATALIGTTHSAWPVAGYVLAVSLVSIAAFAVGGTRRRA